MKVGPCVKGVFFALVIIILILIVLPYQFHGTNSDPLYSTKVLDFPFHNGSYKFILQWTNWRHEPFVWMLRGRETFINRNCTYTNCYIIPHEGNINENLDKFDAILFHGPEVVRYTNVQQLPSERFQEQKYVFVSMESSDYYPVCNSMFDNYFNWTWTYKLNSDIPFRYITVRDSDLRVIGPKEDMHWIPLNDMQEIGMQLKEQLKTKSKAAAWFVSNCEARSKRHIYVAAIQKALQQYGLSVDVYGKCGNMNCPRNRMKDCLNDIKRHYYFYFAFENSNSDDYVTEKLLHALQNDAVPVVYGSANYTRFLPDGSYLNANNIQPIKLAHMMKSLIDNSNKYYDYFRWKNHYTYSDGEDSPETDNYCKLCEKLNNNSLVQKVSVYEHFKQWWTPTNRC